MLKNSIDGKIKLQNYQFFIFLYIVDNSLYQFLNLKNLYCRVSAYLIALNRYETLPKARRLPRSSVFIIDSLIFRLSFTMHQLLRLSIRPVYVNTFV